MHAMAALLVADHLQDLLREAEDERRRKLAHSVRPRRAARTFGIGQRVVGLVRRLLGQPAGTDRPEPACA